MTKRLPLPIVGLMLSMFALGNLWQDTSTDFRILCGTIGFILGLLFIIRILKDCKTFSEEMKNPIMASVIGTFPMALMLFSVYIKPIFGNKAILIWYLAIIFHIILIVYFTINFIIRLDYKNVFASYYIVYVGIVVGSLTSPAFEKKNLGITFFYFGFIAMLILLGLVNYRYIKYKEVPNPAKALFIISSAPASLCLAGYIQASNMPNKAMVIFLLILSQALFIFCLTKFISYVRLPFYPSYASFTFPFVITAIGIKMACGFLKNAGMNPGLLLVLAKIEFYFATIICLYVLIRFVINFVKVKN
ncbi:TDT family transporter [Anaerococcus porci]|uniref:TDT family transporter n=1 Tax=Anaerococcus porci TaxID=2652269 RepID=UPI002A75487A|nr:TDT family transporter [Anaerococcus porci]MDY3005751.1 TDT family transporter [Anaerococcus porci]